ncbi:MAG: hypothetical protein Q9168_006489, partial [Polycauliona sp. 1 TL-2023]
MDKVLTNWILKTVIPRAPAIGTIFCRPTEEWAQCFIRFGYSQQRLPAAPMDCVALNSTSCSSPSTQAALWPASVEYWYGLQAIYSIFLYIKTLSSAILSTTSTPNILQTIYTSTLSNPILPTTTIKTTNTTSPIDAVLLDLLTPTNTTTPQDTLFTSYISTHPLPGNFTTPANDGTIYQDLTDSLTARLEMVMSNFTLFQ